MAAVEDEDFESGLHARAAAPSLEHLEADTAEIQHTAAKTGAGIHRRRCGHRTELQVEVAEALDIVGR